MTIEILRIDAGFDRYKELLDVILAAFAFMDGRIDPPSSAHRLTPASLGEKAAQEIAFAAMDKGRLVGCVFLKPEETSLYIGKLAVHPAAQGKGIGRLLRARRSNGPRTGAFQSPARDPCRTDRKPPALCRLGLWQDGGKPPCRLRPDHLA